MNRNRVTTIIAVLAVILLAGASLCGCMNNAKNENVTDVPAVSVPTDVASENPTEAKETPSEPTKEPEAEQTEAADNNETDSTQATEESGKTEQPDETVAPQQPTVPDTDVPVSEVSDYQRYHNMSGEEQAEFINSFESIEAFFEWYNAAKAEHEKLNPGTGIEGDNIDLGDLVGGNG